MSKRKTKASVSEQTASILIRRIHKFNRMLLRFEREIEKLADKFLRKGKRSQSEIKKNLEDLLKKLEPKKIVNLAHETREELEKDLRKVAEEAIQALKDFEIHMQSFNIKKVFKGARSHLSNALEILGASEIVDQAKLKVQDARRDFLNVLSIPTQRDVEALERKIVSLEKRLSNLTRRAA